MRILFSVRVAIRIELCFPGCPYFFLPGGGLPSEETVAGSVVVTVALRCTPLRPPSVSSVSQMIKCLSYSPSDYDRIGFLPLQQEQDLVDKLQINPKILLSYLTQVEDHYRAAIPYHNSIHAADVAQTMNCLLSLPSLKVLIITVIIISSSSSISRLNSRHSLKLPVFSTMCYWWPMCVCLMINIREVFVFSSFIASSHT